MGGFFVRGQYDGAMSPGQFHIPLLKDHHTHPFLYAALMDAPDLQDVTCKDEAIMRIDRAARANDAELIPVTGWIDSRLQFSDAEIDAFPPMVIFNLSLHSVLVNRRARDLLSSRLPLAADAQGQCFWAEEQVQPVWRHMASMNTTPARLNRFFDFLRAQGVGYAEEMRLAGENEVRVFREAGCIDRTRFWAEPDDYRALSKETKDAVHGLKLFSDGALGARTAALHQPYFGTGGLGRMMYSTAGLHAALKDCVDIGKPIAIHAIGDRAIDEVVSLLRALGPALHAVPEIRIEHAQLISRETALEARRLGVVLSMQPNFSEDSIAYADRLGPARCAANNPFRMLIDDVGYAPGVDLLFGSDGMPHGVSWALRAALFPPYEQQALTVDEFAQGYCFPPGSPGSIAVEISGRDIVYSISPVERTRSRRPS